MSQQITPSQMNNQIYKAKKKAAEKGYELLKKKNDSLKKKMQEIMKELINRKKQLQKEFSEAYLSIATSEYSAGNFYAQVQDQAVKPFFTLNIQSENIAGVQLPIFKIPEMEKNWDKIGRTQGGAQIEITRARFAKLLVLVVDLASLQTSFIKLDKVIRITSRRVNALEFIIVPKFTNILAYIQQELDELAREEKYTVKKVTDNRKKRQAELDKQFLLKKQLAGTAVIKAEYKVAESDNILAKKNDDDNLFG